MLGVAAIALLLLELGEALAANAADAIYLGRVGAGGLGAQLAIGSVLLVFTLGVVGAAADRRERARLLAGLALGSAAVLVLLRVGLAAAPAAAPHALLIVTKQLAAATDLAFWVLVADRLDARQARRLVPVLLAVGGAGMVLGAFATRPLAHALGAEELLSCAAVAYLGAAIGARRLVGRTLERRLGDVVAAPAPGLFATWRGGAAAARSSELVRRLAVVVALAGALGPLLYGALGAAAAARYPDEAALASFYGTLRGFTQVAVLLAQTIVMPALMRFLGVGQALVIAPLVLTGLGAALAARAGLPLIAAAQASARVLDAAVQTPAERLAQNLIARGVRGRVAGFLDGVAKRLGAVAGGLLVVVLAAAPTRLGLAVWLVALAWLAAAVLLARRYGALAVAELGRQPAARSEPDEWRLDEPTRRVLAAELAGSDEAQRERAFDLLARASPRVAAVELTRAAVARPAARARLLAMLDGLLAGALPAVPAPSVDAELFALLDSAAGGERVVLVRAIDQLVTGAGFPRARLEALALGAEADAELRLVATVVLARRAGAHAEIDAALDAVLAVSPAARAAAATALLTGRAPAVAGAATVAAALVELRAEARTAGGERRERLSAWLSAAAHAQAHEPRAHALAFDALAEIAAAGVPATDAWEVGEQVVGDELAPVELRAAAARYLAAAGRYGQSGLAAAALARLLGGANPELTAAAAEGLAVLGAPALPALLGAARFGRRAARHAALEVLRDMRAAPSALDEVIEAELTELHRASAHRAALAGAAGGPAGALLLQRLAERRREVARTLLLVIEVRLGDRRVGAAAERLTSTGDRRSRARALEALDALLPRPLARRLADALEDAPDEVHAARAAEALGGAPDADAATRAELGGQDLLARALVVHALGQAGRAAHRDAIRAAARLPPPAGIDPLRVLRRIADSDEEALDMPGSVDTMAALRAVPILSALSARQLADVAGAVAWETVAAGGAVVGERDDAEALIVVAGGRVRVEWADGRVDEVAAGGSFGDAVLVGAAPAPLRAIAIERAMIGRLARAELERLVDDSPRLGLAMCKALAGEVSVLDLERLAELWRMERRGAHERFVAERRTLTLVERVARGVAVRELDLDDLAPAPGGRTLLWMRPRDPDELDDLRIGVGDPVRMWWDSPDQPDAVLGTFSRRGDGRVGVMIDGDVPERIESGRVNLDGDEPAATFERGERAIGRLRDAKAGSDLAHVRAVLVGERPAGFDVAAAEWTPFDAELNAPQREAVARALAARELALVHGPPGTGKTRTLVEVVRQLVARGERVLCAAASNAAVDHLADQLLRGGVSLLRLGHPARVAPALEAHTLDARMAEHETAGLAREWLAEAQSLRRRATSRRERGARDEANQLYGEARRLELDARKQLKLAEQALLARTPVLCATAAGSDAALIADMAFDTVVLDEATQAVDPVALVALTRARRAVLAGDQHQLPPTVIDVEAARAGLAVTFFERLAGTDALRMLTVQHRMHAAIMAFPSASKYDGRLVAAPSVAAHVLEDLGVAADAGRPGPLVFIDTAGKGWSEQREADDPSTSNPQQAERTAMETRRLLARGVAPGDVAVITPYHAQVRRLVELLAAERAAGVEIGTVDGFQGREKEAVIVDLVRSNDDGELGFLADTRRMNVALTRARRFLLVLGDSATLGNDRYYREFLATVERVGAYVSAWTDE